MTKVKTPSKQYIALLDIKAVLRKWQDLEISDRDALREIGSITIELQKKEWEESHSF